jgi:hypothetical protein
MADELVDQRYEKGIAIRGRSADHRESHEQWLPTDLTPGGQS